VLFFTNKFVNFCASPLIAGGPPDVKKVGDTVLVPGATAPMPLPIAVILRLTS
jgi:hypothetical protein